MLVSENRVLDLQSKQVPAGLPVVEARVPDLGLLSVQNCSLEGEKGRMGVGCSEMLGCPGPASVSFLPCLSLQLFPLLVSPFLFLLSISLIYSLFFFTEIFFLILCSTLTCLFISSLVS